MAEATPNTFDPVMARREVSFDAKLALRLVREQFADLNAQTIEYLGSGWDFDAFRVDGDWVFRFPKRKESEQMLECEGRLLEAIASRLPLAVPRFEKRGRATSAFALEFVGYRLVQGVGADTVPKLDEVQAGETLGRALDALHSTPASVVADLGLSSHPVGLDAWRTSLVRVADAAREQLPSEWLSVCDAYLNGEVPLPPAADLPEALLHNDVCPDHILADPATGRVTGMIDFSDVAWGDPALDFVGLWIWKGRAFCEAALAHYDRPLDTGFMPRMEWLARTLSLLWLAEACQERMGEGNLDKHRDWIAAAFEIA